MRRGGFQAALFVLACSCWGGLARAQSSASFPEPAPTPVVPTPAPNQYTPPPPAPYIPPAPTQPVPTQPVPAPVAPAPAPEYFPPSVALPTPYQPPATNPSYSYENLPPLLPYKKGLPVPPGYRVVQRSATGLTAGGGVTFGVAYAAALGLAATQNFENGTAYTAIPVIGPWAAIGGRTFKCKTSKLPATTDTAAAQKAITSAINKCVGTAFDEVVTVVFLTADGLVQATGAVLFFVGLASGYEELVRKDLPKASVEVFPEGGGGLSVTGMF